MSSPEISFTPDELIERFATETAHLSEEERLLSWPPVLQQLSRSDEQLFDIEDPIRLEVGKPVRTAGTFHCNPDGSAPVFDAIVDRPFRVVPEAIRFNLPDSSFTGLTHLRGIDMQVDLEASQLGAKDLGRIVAITDIEKPNSGLVNNYDSGYVRGRVTGITEGDPAVFPEYSVTKAHVALSQAHGVLHVVSRRTDEPGINQPLRYISFRGVPHQEAIPRVGDIVSGRALDHDAPRRTAQIPLLNLLFRP